MRNVNEHAGRRVLRDNAVRLAGLQQIGRYRHAAAGGGLSEHSHSGGLEICYLARGKQVYRVAGRRYELRGGDCYMTFPDEVHDTAETPQEKGVLYWMVLDCRQPNGAIGLLPGREARKLRKALLAVPGRHFTLGEAPRDLLDELIDILAGDEPMRQVRATSLLSRFLLMLIDRAASQPQRNVSPPMGDLLDYVDANLDEPLSVPQLAERVGLSVSRFKSRFRGEMGLPPGEYVLRRKIDAACRRLRETDETITAIAMRLGFSTSQYFATVFRRFMRTTPTAWRAAGR